LEPKALEDVVGLGHLALALASFGPGFGICGLTASSLWRILRGHDVCNILTGRPNRCLLHGQGRGNNILLL